MNPENIVIILVNPQSPGNIGSSARAMKNMGFTQLRVVNAHIWRDPGEACDEAEKMAWNARDVLHSAETFATLSEALTDIQWVIGTSARPGRYRDPRPLSSLTGEIRQSSMDNKIAILFGSERHGLTTDDLSHCQELITIPTSSLYPTLNLSQSVLLVCYELFVDRSTPEKSSESLAMQREIDALTDQARRVLREIGYLNPQNPDHALQILCKIFGRSGLTPGEVRTLRGVLRQVDWAARRWCPPQW